MIKQITALLHVNQKQDTYVMKTIRVQVLVSVEMANWMWEKIAIQSLTARLNANQKLVTHVPITFASAVEIVFYKLDKNVTMEISQDAHNAKLSLPTNAKVLCRLPHCVTSVETPYMNLVKSAITETNLVA